MIEIRLAKKGEEINQKNIWKSCFGDEDTYIDLYFSNQYKEDETALLLYDGEIAAMATMIPGKLKMPSGKSLELAMLYAVATHPKYQGKGFSTKIMNFCHNHLMEKGINLSILVPAEKSLFEFYSKRGYKEAFEMREVTLTYDQISGLKTTINQEVLIEPVGASEYNKRRRRLLANHSYVDYNDDEIDYQKKVSKAFGADLYGINMGDVQGCAIVEWISQSEIMIKEILMPDHLIEDGLRKIAQVLPAEDYRVRLPAYFGEALGGTIKPFGMAKLSGHIANGIKEEIFQGKLGYMGLAYD